MKNKNRFWIYDIESYPNIFTLSVVFDNGKGMRTYELSDRKDEIPELLAFLRNVKSVNHKMVGFNNSGYDYQVLHYILEKSKKARQNNTCVSITSKELFDFGSKIIQSQMKDGFGIGVREKDFMLPQVDLFLIHHFNNRARMTSLKILEVRMLSDNVEDLPYAIGQVLTHDEMDVLVEYNQHDVWQTLKFFNESKEAVEFREKLTEQYGFDCTNFNDTKIGKQYFINRLEKQKQGSCYYMQGRQRKMRQTRRDVIHLKDVMLPYLEFKRPEFKAVHEWFARQSIKETKGVFSDLLESDLGSVAQYAEMKTKRKKINDPIDSKNKRYEPTEKHIASLRKQQPMGWVEEKELKSPKGAKSYYWCYNMAETINVVVEGLRYDYGSGGAHSSVSPRTVISDNDGDIIDCDVASMYPNIAIVNRLFPEHLSEAFCDVYEDIYNTRKSYPKGSAENAVMKLALNGVYGDSNNEYSPFYDPQYTMTITVGGQLSITMLVDKFVGIEGCKIIQVNTDGVTAYVPKNKQKEYYEICKQWEKETKLVLEFVEYDKMFIRDVNNYIAVYKE